MKNLSARKLTSVLLAGALIIGGSIAMSASANAVGKQGTTCTKLKAKSGVYTCSKNPITPTSTKLIWLTVECAQTQVDYQANLDNMNSYTKDATNSTNQSKSVLASYQNALTVAQAALNDIMNTKVYAIEYVPGSSNPPVPSVTAIGYNAAVAAYTAKISADQTKLASYQAALAKDTAGSTQATSDQKSIADFKLGITSRQNTISQLAKTLASKQRSIASYQSEITQWTSTVNGSISGQKTLTAQLKTAVTSAKTARTLACKAGR